MAGLGWGEELGTEGHGCILGGMMDLLFILIVVMVT